MELALEAGAEDLQSGDDGFDVYTAPESFQQVHKALDEAGVPTEEAAIVMEPQNTVEVKGKKAEQCLKLLELLEDHDDVQNVYANLEIPDGDTSGLA